MAGYDYGGGPGGEWGHGNGHGHHPPGDAPYRMDQDNANLAPTPSRHNGGHGNQSGRPPASPAMSPENTDTESRRSGERNGSRPRGSRSASGQVRACKKCGEPLTGQFVRALDGTFHLDCFRCRVSLLWEPPTGVSLVC
jgi:hypothetical protein